MKKSNKMVQILYCYTLLILSNSIMAELSTVEIDTKLNLLQEELQKLLEKHTDFNLSISGIAYIDSLDGSKYYSASLFTNDTNNDNKDPAYYDELFKNPDNELSGFKYKTTEIVNFKTNIVIPKPTWRIQIKYI
ncbi:unknown similar to AMEV018 [Mythimna separata entomopoxvirus 'L']|uniref:Uncharacterized protein n=1 Tax=Mythimna separata entomopoxvirus 'L' TaxID=1293572 RepID=A0A916KQ27_9POXV|nr:unknown similar to AMEV018 [Mythimna separata entomopoxvirus 'L']CCU56239.1 unknown similar to AMEV018 [Mythimna separata entomopoxvirus 'L']